MIHRKPNLSPEMHAALDELDEAREALVMMTNPQFYWLRWFAKHGGRGRLEGYQVLMEDKSPSGGHPIIVFLNLIAAGCLAGSGGELYITERGRKHLERTETMPLL